jgi:hypothetical protein
MNVAFLLSPHANHSASREMTSFFLLKLDSSLFKKQISNSTERSYFCLKAALDTPKYFHLILTDYQVLLASGIAIKYTDKP